jgi:hypothetical protein
VPSGRVTIPSLERFLPRALVRFADRRLRKRAGARFGALYALGVGVSYALLILWSGGDGGRAARLLVMRELTTATWIVTGLFSLSLAADWTRLDREEGVLGLLRLRGLSPDNLERARFYAGARRIALLVGLTTIACCALAGSRIRSLQSAGELVTLALAAAVYACVVGGAASGLCLLSRVLAPGSGRAFLLALVLLPHAARELWPALPSVPSAVSWLLDTVGRAGGVAS